jgi:CheY-like chemotaxis protein/class 3 adenylate cyclase
MSSDSSHLSDYNDHNEMTVTKPSIDDENSTNNTSASDMRVSFSSEIKKMMTTEQINFINFRQNYCVGFIDIVDSTQHSYKIKEFQKLAKFYAIFINSISTIIHQFDGKIVKSSGDGIFFYFPKTANQQNQKALKDVFDCAACMVNSNKALNAELDQDNLPHIDYRISMDYGLTEIALSANNTEVDLFGLVVNVCAKMNKLSKKNGIVIGENLHELLMDSPFIIDYDLQKLNTSMQKADTGFYYLYSLIKKTEQEIKNNTKRNHSPVLSSSLSSTTPPSATFFPNEQDQQLIANTTSFNILVIDDDEDILYTYKSLLRKEGYKVNVFSNSSEALKHVKENKLHNYDLVVMDIRMPDINGIKLFYWFKAIDPYMNIIFITALDLIGEFVDALPGIKTNEILRKPIGNREFLSAIKMRLLK